LRLQKQSIPHTYRAAEQWSRRILDQQSSRAAEQQEIPLICPLQRGIIKTIKHNKNPSFLIETPQKIRE